MQFWVFFILDTFCASTVSLALRLGERSCSGDQLEQIVRDRTFYFAFIIEKNLLSFYQGILKKIRLGYFTPIIYWINSSHYS
jgi:hypothetical protein